MSSESDDDFQSADEGSDYEDFEPGVPMKQELIQPQQLTSSLSPQNDPLSSDEGEEDVDDFEEDYDNKKVPTESECGQKPHHVDRSVKTSQLKEKVLEKEVKKKEENGSDHEMGAAFSKLSIRDTLPKNSENVPPKIESTLMTDRVSHEDAQKGSEMDQGNCNPENSKEEKILDIDEFGDDDVIKEGDLHFSSSKENNEEDTRHIEKKERDKEKFIVSSSNVDISEAKHVEMSTCEPEKIKIVEDICPHVEKVKHSQETEKVEMKKTCKSEDVLEVEIHDTEKSEQTDISHRKEEVNQTDNSNISIKAEEAKSTDPKKRDPVDNSKTRPIRESKIGMKKPREKLGERLGARKLGSRVEKKTLEGISSDSFIKPKDISSEVHRCIPQNALEEQKGNQEKEGGISKEMAENLKKRELEEQQQRWQQIQQDGGRTNVSAEDAADFDGWGGSWGGWGTTLLSAASTLTREVGRGVGTVMETVEGSLGVPDPAIMAQEIAEEEKKSKSEEKCSTRKVVEENQGLDGKSSNGNEDRAVDVNTDVGGEGVKSVADYSFGGLSSLGSLVSGVSGALETASSKVLLGGLDTLEVIGRKAMDVIQEGDPGLRKKRAILSNRNPNLSLALQEAREQAAKKENEKQDGGKDSKLSHKVAFDEAWEATEGPVHLEALSLVARQCESKLASMLQSLPHYLLEKLHTTNAKIKSTCEQEEENFVEGDIEEQVINIVPQIGLPLHSKKITTAWSSVKETGSLIEEAGVVDGPTAERELYTVLAALVVQLSAVTHKGAELSLITPQADPLTVALQFKELTNAVCSGIENIADQVCGAITTGASAADPQVNNTITNIYLQTACGSSYIQQGMVLLSSVLQYANAKQMVAQLS